MKEKIKNEYAVKNGFDDWDDLLCNALPDFGRFAINEVMDIFVNQEVEKRIAERMPNKRDTEQARTNVLQQYLVGNISLYDVVCQTELFYCSRLTNPGVSSQKTEGGGE